jgi:hypothetical protein
VHQAERQRDQGADVTATAAHEVVGADKHDAQRDRRLDDVRRRRDEIERGQRQRDAVADGEGGHDFEQRLPSAAKQQQADQKQDVVGSNQNVMNARRHERLDDRQRSLRRARVIGTVRIVHCEHELLTEARVFVDVHKRLMQTVVGEHHGVNRQRRRADRVNPELQLESLALWKHLDVAPLNRQLLPVGAQREPLVDEGGEPVDVAERDRSIEEPLGCSDVQIMRDVDDVDDESAFDDVSADAQIEIAERRRVCRHWRRRPKQAQRQQNFQNLLEQATSLSVKIPPPMWQHNYAPLSGSLGGSAVVAAIPILVLFLMLGVFRRPAWMSAVSALISAFVVALAVYGMPVNLALISVIYGAAFGLFPIAWIVFAAIMLYRLAVDTGKFEIIKDSVGGLSSDRRLQAMFIAFSFGAFIEGAAGFGAPVAYRVRCSRASVSTRSTPLASVFSPTRHRSRSDRSAFP